MDSDDDFPPDLVPAHDLVGSMATGHPREKSLTTTRDCQTNQPSTVEGETESTTEPSTSVPVTILTGFLGAGKTTLLNYILTQDHGRRIAVIENEVGDSMDIEALIARDGADGSTLADNLFELKNGCICCSVKDDLVRTLETLLERRSKFDYIIIETTGLANPGPVAGMFWLDDAVESVLRLDGIVTLVDAKNIRRQLQRGAEDGTVNHENVEDLFGRRGMVPNEAAIQVAYADRVLINKTDLVSKEVLDDVMAQVRAINTVAQVRCTRRSVVDLDWVLDTKCFSPELALAVDSGALSRGGLAPERGEGQGLEGSEAVQREPVLEYHDEGVHNCGHDHDHDHDHDHHDHDGQSEGPGGKPCSVHDPTVTTCTVDLLGSVELRRLDLWLGELLWNPLGETEIYRVKGVVSAVGRDERFVVQGVADLFEVSPANTSGSAWREGETRHCKIVFIGRHLYRNELELGLRSCIV